MTSTLWWILTSGATSVTMPGNATGNLTAYAIGGGVCGSPGIDPAAQLEHLKRPELFTSHGQAGPGGWYCSVAVTGIVAGASYDCHIASGSPPVTILSDWSDLYFGSPTTLSDSTWLKNTPGGGGGYYIFAPGGDVWADDPVGDVQIEGGFNGEPPAPSGIGGTMNFIGSAGGGAAGGPAGALDFETQDGAAAGTAIPGAVAVSGDFGIRMEGSGGGSGNITSSGSPRPGRGTRTVYGSGAASGQPSSGGNGETVTWNDSALSGYASLLMPTVSGLPVSGDGITSNTGFLLGSNDFTIEGFTQVPIPFTTIPPGTNWQGTAIGVWDVSGNQRSWGIGVGTFGMQFMYSDDGSRASFWTTDSIDFPYFGYPFDLTHRYTAFSTYYGPPSNGYGWTHWAFTRSGNNMQSFIDGYVRPTNIGFSGLYNYYIPVSGSPFASSAGLSIGCIQNGSGVTASGDFNFFDSSAGPMAGWFGDMRITLGSALYSAALTASGEVSGRAFVPPTAPLAGGVFSVNWLGAKGDTSTTASGATLTFHGNAQLDTDQYCFPVLPTAVANGDATPGASGAVWTGVIINQGNISATVGPGGGGGAGASHIGRYRMETGGTGAAGGLYGGGGGQGGSVNAGLYVDLGFVSAASGVGGEGAPGVLVLAIEVNSATTSGVSCDFSMSIDTNEIADVYVVASDGSLYAAGVLGNSVFPVGSYGAPARGLVASGTTLYSILPGASQLGIFHTRPRTSGFVATPMTTPAEIAVSGSFVGIAGWDVYSWSSGFSAFSVYPLNDNLLAAASLSASSVSLYTGDANGVFTVGQIVSGLGSPISLAWTKAGGALLVGDTANNAVKILDYSGGVLSLAQTLSISGAAAIAIALDSVHGLVCQPSQNSVTTISASGSGWASGTTIAVGNPQSIIAISDAEIAVGCSSGLAYYTLASGVWSLDSTVSLPFVPTALALDSANAVVAAGASGAVGYIRESGVTGTFSGSVNGMAWVKGQTIVADQTNALIRIFSLLNSVVSQQFSIAAPTGVDALVVASGTILAASSGQTDFYQFGAPYQLNQAPSGKVSAYNITTSGWTTTALPFGQVPTAIAFTSGGDLLVATAANNVYTVSISGGIIASGVIAQFPGQPQGISIGMSSLLTSGDTANSTSALNNSYQTGV